MTYYYFSSATLNGLITLMNNKKLPDQHVLPPFYDGTNYIAIYWF